MCKFNENPVDCFNWRALSVNYIASNEEYPRFEIELSGLYKKGSAIDPGKLSNISRLIEDRMNGKEGEKEKMNSYEIAIEKVRTLNNDPNKLVMKSMLNSTYGVHYYDRTTRPVFMLEIKNVIFNPPATIVFWNDGTKTVVKCQNGEAFDPEKGITMAFFKKMHGNKGHYFEEIKKWTEGYTNSDGVEVLFSFNNWSEAASVLDKIEDLRKENGEGPVKKEVCEDSKWHIWYKIGMLDEIHCYEKDYSTKSSAVRRAKKLCECNDYNITIWTVSKKAPFGPESDDIEWHFN